MRNLLSSGSLALSLLAISSPVKAGDWACTVALCLANPAGPMAVPECVPPILKLYKQLARGGGFPFCSSSEGAVSFTRYGKEYFAECPPGTTPIDMQIVEHGPVHRLCKTHTAGKDEFVRPPRREKPSFLEYQVQGQTHRIWW